MPPVTLMTKQNKTHRSPIVLPLRARMQELEAPNHANDLLVKYSHATKRDARE